MAIDLREFASGDTDYIAKLNQNVAILEEAINGLITQVGAIPGGQTSGIMMDAMFNHADALIGPSAYKPTISGTTLNIAPGGAYLAETQKAVQSIATTPLAFSVQPAGTYYVNISSLGVPQLANSPASAGGDAYSVYWSGSALSSITKLMPTAFDVIEAEGSRDSVQMDQAFLTLDERLEAGEQVAADAQAAADEASDRIDALEAELEFSKADPVPVYRKIGCSIDNTIGLKGAIQIDFEGTIIGWSIIADQVGDVTVEVDRKASSPPPAAPQLPNTSTDVISASAPIALSSAQSAARAEAGVSTWNTDLQPWDVIQFNVLSIATITRANLYVRVKEAPPYVNVHLAHIPAGPDLSGVTAQYGPNVISLA